MRRTIRTVLGASLLILALWLAIAWLRAPSLWHVTSSVAVVNAPILTLHSPIEGIVASPPPPIGKAVTADFPLMRIDNPLVDNSHLEELKTEAASLGERLAALEKQFRALDELKEELAGKARYYHTAAERRLE